MNTHNCGIGGEGNPPFILQVSLHFQNVTVWCGVFAEFMLCSFFFEELTPKGLVTCSVTEKRYASLESNSVPSLQARQCLDRTIFMQDGASPHIAICVKKVLKGILQKIMSSVAIFVVPGLQDPLGLKPCDFWL